MKDKYDEQTERLLPCDCNNRDGREGHFSSCAGYWREGVADALRELGNERDKLRAEHEASMAHWLSISQGYLAERDKLIYELLVIGDMAVVDFDDEVVGMVDEIVKPLTPMTTYAEARRAEISQTATLRARVAELEPMVDDLWRALTPEMRHKFNTRWMKDSGKLND